MRQSTRISEGAPRLSRTLRRWSYSLYLIVFLCLIADPGSALPVISEARVRAASGSVHGASRDAVQAALLAAVREVVQRHVLSPDLLHHDATINRAVLARAPRYVLRYGIVEERWEDLEVVVRIEAEVDVERVLSSLVSAGVPVSALAVKPRLLLVRLSPGAGPTLGAASRVLETNGYQTRTWSGDLPGLEGGVAAEVDESRIAEWTLSAGCHLALVLAAGEEEATALPDALAAPAPYLPGQGAGFWYDPGGEPARHTLRLSAWLVDASGPATLAEIEAAGLGVAADPESALANAAELAGLDLAYETMRLLEQSGWAPTGEASTLKLRVVGLVDPLLVEEVGAALEALPEIRRASLTEIVASGAIWRLDVVGSGLDWGAVLASARLPRGSLRWEGDVTNPGEDQQLVAERVMRVNWQAP